MAMMVGMVTVVIHVVLFAPRVTVTLGVLVDTVAGADVVISVQKGIRSITDLTGVMLKIPNTRQ